MALFLYQKGTSYSHQTHGCRNDKNDLVAARSVKKHSTHVCPKAPGQMMHGGRKSGKKADMSQSVKSAHQGCGERRRYQKSKAEQDCENVEIDLIGIFQYQ